MADDIKKIFEKLNLVGSLKHLKKTLYRERNTSPDEILHIEKLFKDDVEFWNKLLATGEKSV
jgi:hypothetical protein